MSKVLMSKYIQEYIQSNRDLVSKVLEARSKGENKITLTNKGVTRTFIGIQVL